MGFKRRNRGLFPSRAENRVNEVGKQGWKGRNKGRIGGAGGLLAADGTAGGVRVLDMSRLPPVLTRLQAPRTGLVSVGHPRSRGVS